MRMHPLRAVRITRRLFGISLAMTLVYRIEFVTYEISTILSPIIGLIIWRAAIANGADLPMTQNDITLYFLLLSFVSMATSSWSSGFLAEEIREGQLNKWLSRPGSTHFNLIANNLAEKAVKTVILVPMIAIAWYLVRADAALPTNPGHWLIFAVTIVIASMMAIGLDVLIGSLAFWIDDVSGVDTARQMLKGVLAGQLIPLALMPAELHGMLTIQPFRYLISFPLEVVTGTLSNSQIATGFALQCAWAGVTIGAAIWVWSQGLRRYEAFGA